MIPAADATRLGSMLDRLRQWHSGRRPLVLALLVCVQLAALDVPCLDPESDVACAPASLAGSDGTTRLYTDVGPHTEQCGLCQWLRRLPLPGDPQPGSAAGSRHAVLHRTSPSNTLRSEPLERDPARAPPA